MIAIRWTVLFLFISLRSLTWAAAEGRGLSVTGECIKTLVPDRGAFTYYLENVEAQPNVAIKKTTDGYNQLKEKVLKLKLKSGQVETVDFSVYEEFDWNNNQKKSKGFRARMGLRVETSDLARLGELIQLGADQKIKTISGPENFVSLEMRQKENESCLDVALKNAKDKAEKLATSGNVKLGALISVTEGDAVASEPIPAYSRSMSKMEMASSDVSMAPQVDARSEKMRVTLRAIYGIK